MSALKRHVSATAAAVHSFNNIEPGHVTANRLEQTCQLKDSFQILINELLDKPPKATATVCLYADAGLLKALVPFLTRLPICGFAYWRTNSCEQLGLKLWEKGMELLHLVVALGNSWRETLPHVAKIVTRAVLPFSPLSPSLPGEQEAPHSPSSVGRGRKIVEPLTLCSEGVGL
jgi:hypothetical protein